MLLLTKQLIFFKQKTNEPIVKKINVSMIIFGNARIISKELIICLDFIWRWNHLKKKKSSEQTIEYLQIVIENDNNNNHNKINNNPELVFQKTML